MTDETQPSVRQRLTGHHRAAWTSQGRLVLRDVLDAATLATLRRSVDEVSNWAGAANECADGDSEPCGRKPPGLHHFEATDRGPALARSERFADDHAELDGFIRRGPVADLVGELLGEPAVLFKEKINYKHPGGAGFAPHQDATAYRFVDHHLSVLVPIDPATTASGCLFFADGHHRGTLPIDARGRIAEAEVAALSWQPVEVQPGDLAAFDSYAPHYSGTNSTDRPRRAIYLTYNARSRGDFREAYYDDKATEFAREGEAFDGARVRMSINDDFLGRPVPPARPVESEQG